MLTELQIKGFRGFEDFSLYRDLTERGMSDPAMNGTVGKFYSLRGQTLQMPQSGKVIKPGVLNPRFELLLIFAP
ncbi:MAG: hypothetical protein GY795_13000 [Desulfobacterales bacterium]|nr:hypothetical protein [Desulfobacterales bacterium]